MVLVLSLRKSLLVLLGAVLLGLPACDPQTAAVISQPAAPPLRVGAAITIAHLSDTHVGLGRAPHAAANLRLAVERINQRAPHAVVVTGDIAQNAAGWREARSILRSLKAPVYYAPGNHDTHAWSMEEYRSTFGRDYYRVDIGPVTLLVLNSQLMGRWDDFNAQVPRAMPAAGRAELDKMLDWMERQARELEGGQRTVIAAQHVPHFQAPNILPNSRPYWTTQEPYRQQVLALKERLGIREVLAGHWHQDALFQRGGITYRVAPATGWLPHGGKLGFAMHTIAGGRVTTEFVYPSGMR